MNEDKRKKEKEKQNEKENGKGGGGEYKKEHKYLPNIHTTSIRTHVYTYT